MLGESTQDVVQHDIKARTGALQLAPRRCLSYQQTSIVCELLHELSRLSCIRRATGKLTQSRWNPPCGAHEQL